jgi:DUF4097 and DUF4098 domain-containing protein YvlB
MKRFKYIIPLFCLLIIQPVFSQQKQTRQIIIALSKPNQHGSLSIRNNEGSIKVTGYNGNNVIIEASFEGKPDNSSKAGLKRINDRSLNLEAEENDNNIRISDIIVDFKVDFDIKVPYSFSLNINSLDDGDIELHNISGEFVLNNNSGNIFLFNVSGSAVASSLDGNITAQFNKVNTDLPMKFTTLSGKIDLTLPPQLKATLDLRSEFGDILTDINLDIDNKGILKESSKNGLKRFTLESSITGKLNGGGQRITLKALDGNIYIRKGK